MSVQSSVTGLRAAPPAVPECWSVSPVCNSNRKPCSPRRPAGQAGRDRETHTVSETTIESVAKSPAFPRMAVSKLGLPISSSSSQRKWMLTGTFCSKAYRAPKSAVIAGPLSSVVPRPR